MCVWVPNRNTLDEKLLVHKKYNIENKKWSFHTMEDIDRFRMFWCVCIPVRFEIGIIALYISYRVPELLPFVLSWVQLLPQ